MHFPLRFPLRLSQQCALPPASSAKLQALLPASTVRGWVQMAVNGNVDPQDEADSVALTLRWVGQAEGRSLNHTHRGQGVDKDYATNVLTFAYGVEGGVLSADIVLCWPVLLAEAKTQGKPPKDHAAHLIIHGVLHALGFDHEAEDEALAMETLETQLLARLKIADPY